MCANAIMGCGYAIMLLAVCKYNLVCMRLIYCVDAINVLSRCDYKKSQTWLFI